jgi:hypothetical protein
MSRTTTVTRMYETDWELGEEGPRKRRLTEAERLERIAYDLSAGLDVSTELEGCIVRVLAGLPKRVAEYAIKRCIFLEAMPYGQVLPGRIVTVRSGGKPRWIVLFSHRLPAKHADGIIAHEIAHAWCRHDRYAMDITAECEVEASNLAGTWGFDGMGADPKHHLHGRRNNR